jgi:hypothetical protein
LEPTNAIRDELDAFGHCIQNNLNEAVSIEEGYEALKVAYQILDRIQSP